MSWKQKTGNSFFHQKPTLLVPILKSAENLISLIDDGFNGADNMNVIFGKIGIIDVGVLTFFFLKCPRNACWFSVTLLL